MAKDQFPSFFAAPPRASDLEGSFSVVKNASSSWFPSTIAAPSWASDLGGLPLVVKDPPLSGWSSLFASIEARLQFVAPIVKDGKKLVVIPKSFLIEEFLFRMIVNLVSSLVPLLKFG